MKGTKGIKNPPKSATRGIFWEHTFSQQTKLNFLKSNKVATGSRRGKFTTSDLKKMLLLSRGPRNQL